MAIGQDKTRLQLTLPAGLIEKIDAICEKANISRSVWIEYTLGMAADSYEGLTDAVARIAIDAESQHR